MLLRTFGFLCAVVVVSYCAPGPDYPRRIPTEISACYADSKYNDRYARYPMSIDGLISLVRKIELHSAVQMWDVARLASTLLRRFRYDGIEDAESQTEFTTPIKKFAPEADKYSLIWSLIPGETSDFPEEVLSGEEKCALHFMLSYSVNRTMRAEERFPRQSPNTRSVDSLDNDIVNSLLDVIMEDKAEESVVPSISTVQSAVGVADDAWEDETVEDDNFSRKKRETSYGIPVSKSPLESGIVHTPFGTVAAGALIAGIAAGLEPETISLKEWIGFESTNNWTSSVMDRTVNNIWATTLASDIAQSGLLRIHMSHTTAGPSGRWNDTVALCPKEYSLEDEDPSFLTNAEIFGGIDGLLLGLKLRTWDKDYLKLSAILSSYYSLEGLPQDRSYRACNRINNFMDPKKVDHVMLKDQALTFVVAYYDTDTTGIPVFKPTTDRFAKAEEFVKTTYNDLTKLLNNAEDMQENFPPCQGIATLPTAEAPKTDSDITFVIDQYTYGEEDIVKQKELAGWLALHLNIVPGGSQLSLVSSYDGNELVTKNTTNKAQLACEIKTKSIPVQNQRKLHDVLAKLGKSLDAERSGETARKISGTNAKVVLFSVSGRAPSTDDIEKLKKQYELFKEAHNDVRLLFAVGGTSSSEVYKQFVQDPDKDIFKLSFFATNKEAAAVMAMRSKSLSARFVYPECSTPMNESNFTHNIYVTPGTQKYFKIMPASMDLSTDLKLTFGVQYGSAEVCLSRNQEPPKSASALSVCKAVPESGGTLDFTNHRVPCMSGSCTPIYGSIRVPDLKDTTSCPDSACESLEQVKVTFSHSGMRCSKDAGKSASTNLFASQILLLLSALLAYYVI